MSLAGFAAFLVRGGVVLEFYFIPLLALVAIAGVGVIQLPLRMGFIKDATLRRVYTIGVLGLLLLHQFALIPGNPAFTRNENKNLLAAVDWVAENVPKDAAIATDSYALIFLNEKNGFTRTDYNWKLEYDPDITDKIANDWKNIDYVISTHEVIKQAREGATPDIKKAILHSEVVASFTEGTTSFNDLPNLISTNGDWVQVLKVKNDNEIITQDTWQWLLGETFTDYGRIVDNKDSQTTTSLLQSNALLRAVNEDDRQRFDGIWSWTTDHLQNRSSDALLSSEWKPIEPGSEEFGVSNSNSDTLADIEAAYALLQASELWQSAAYRDEADQLLDSIWENSVIERADRLFLMPFSSAPSPLQPINPSHIALPYLESFATEDIDHDWATLVDHGIKTLSEIQDPVTGLFPNWISVDADGNYESAASFAGSYADVFSYEAFKVIHHLSASSDASAWPLLQKYGRFIENRYQLDAFIPAVINQNGTSDVDFDDTIMYATAYLGLDSISSELSAELLRDKVLSQFDEDTGVWGGLDSNASNRLWLPRFAIFNQGLTISEPVPDRWLPATTSE